MKKEVFLKAYINKNLGDDLFIRDIALRHPHINFYVFSSEEKAKGFSDLKNIRVSSTIIYSLHWFILKFFHKTYIRDFFEKKKQACVFIAGSVFVEPKEFNRPKSIEQNKNMFVIGANFGPFYTNEYVAYTREKFLKMSDICFRDSYSYNMFKDLGNVRWTSDVLFGYKYYPRCIQGTGIGISVINLNSRTELTSMADSYYDTLAKLVDICSSRGIKVTLFGFCVNEKDDKAIEIVLGRCQSSADVCIYNGDTEDFLNKFNSCEYILATRFHAMIIGWVLRKKVLPIIYNGKQLNVIYDLNYKEKCWNILEGQAYEAELLLTDCLTTKILEDVDTYIKNAEIQYKVFDNYVQNL